MTGEPGRNRQPVLDSGRARQQSEKWERSTRHRTTRGGPRDGLGTTWWECPARAAVRGRAPPCGGPGTPRRLGPAVRTASRGPARHTDAMSRPPRTRPTLEEVAARAGVGRGTASRVINGGEKVSERARLAVEQAIAELGYVPNAAARALVTRRTDAVALVIAESEERVFGEPFFAGDHPRHRLGARRGRPPADPAARPGLAAARRARRLPHPPARRRRAAALAARRRRAPGADPRPRRTRRGRRPPRRRRQRLRRRRQRRRVPGSPSSTWPAWAAAHRDDRRPRRHGRRPLALRGVRRRPGRRRPAGRRPARGPGRLRPGQRRGVHAGAARRAGSTSTPSSAPTT